MTLLPAVRDQYLAFPYPVRDPEDERERLLHGLLGQLALLDHLFWAGRRTIDERFRVLDAGCGTGDVSIFLAEQLRDSGAAVVSLDFSSASLEIARGRAEIRGLKNIEFVEAAIDDLPGLGLAPFDYIVSAGVLHHLASPQEGLATLAGALKPDGGIGLMVYGHYGRTAIYHLQELFRAIAPETLTPEQRLRTVRRTLSQLRPDHPGTLYADSWEAEVGEHGDAGLYDLFLHSQDRAYTVPQIYDWLEDAGLRLHSFGLPLAYDPRSWAPDVETEGRPPRELHALAELLHGRMGNHTFFATLAGNDPARAPSPDDECAVPAWAYLDGEGHREELLKGRGAISVTLGAFTVTVQLNALNRALLRRVDGETALGEIIAATANQFSAVTAKEVRQEWRRVFTDLNGMHYLVLNPPR